MFRTFLQNRIIICSSNLFYCFLCDRTLVVNSYSQAIDHTEDEEHKQRISKHNIKTEKKWIKRLCKVPETQGKMFVDNSIITWDKYPNFKCYVCHSSLSSKSMHNHIRTKNHNNNLQRLSDIKDFQLQIKKTISPLTASQIYCNLPNRKHKKGAKYSKNKKKEQNNSEQHQINNTLKNATQNLDLYHNALENNLQKEADLNFFSNEKSNQSLDLKENIEIIPQSISKIVNDNSEINHLLQPSTDEDNSQTIVSIHECSICKVELTMEEVLYHSTNHLFDQYDLKDVDIIHFKPLKTFGDIANCLLCEKQIKDLKELIFHLRSLEHRNNFQFFIHRKLNVKNKEFYKTNNHQEIDTTKDFNLEYYFCKKYFCKICNMKVPKGNVCEHIKGSNHRRKLELFPSSSFNNECIPETSSDPLTVKYICFICDQEFLTDKQIIIHFNELDHSYRINSFLSIIHLHKQSLNSKNESSNEINAEMTKTGNTIIACNHNVNGKKISNAREKNESNIQQSRQFQKNTAENSELNDSMKKIIKEGGCVNFISKGANDGSSQLKKVNENISIFEENNTKIYCNSHYNCENHVSTSNNALRIMKPNKSLGSSSEPKSPLSDLLKLRNQHTRIFSKRLQPTGPTTTKSKKKKVISSSLVYFSETYFKLCLEGKKENIYNINCNSIFMFDLGIKLTFARESRRICIPCCQKFSNDEFSIFTHLFSEEHVMHLIDMKMQAKEFEDFPEQFSDLELALEYMREVDDDTVICYACEIITTNNDLDLKAHIKLSPHIDNVEIWKKEACNITNEMLQNAWYYSQQFCCEICKKRFDFEYEFAEHLVNQKHLLKSKTVKDCKFHLCPVCATFWYGKEDSFMCHIKNDFHKLFLNRKDFMIPKMSDTINLFLEELEERANNLLSRSDFVISNENEKEKSLLFSIEETVKCIYPQAQAYIFGSRLSYLGFPDSDIDIFLDCKNHYATKNSLDKCLQYLDSVKEKFEVHKDWLIEESVRQSRIPILKLRHRPTGLKCDISFSNGLSVEKSTLIRNINIAYPKCRAMILFLKKWLIYCRLSGPDGISTFALAWLVIFFLQKQKKIIPPIYNLLKQENKKFVDGWDCGYKNDIPVKFEEISLKKLVKEFFEYYSQFDFKTRVICPFLGNDILKRRFRNINAFPTEMETYKKRLSSEQLEYFRIDSPLCIQDPVDLSQNMTKAVKKLKLRCLMQYCLESSVILNIES